MGMIIEGYAAAAEALGRRYDRIDPAVLYAPVQAYFPTEPCYILDIGAGSGRDAAWLAKQGFDVLAVEPVAAFRQGGTGQKWLDDRLPTLVKTRDLNQKFDFILMNAVFQHVAPEARAEAMRNVSVLLAEGGRIVMSLRHGPFAPSRWAYALDADEIEDIATDCGLKALFRGETGAMGAENKVAAVRWTWFVFMGGC